MEIPIGSYHVSSVRYVLLLVFPARYRNRANVELPVASKNVLNLDGKWSFSLRSCPKNALASNFYEESYEETRAATSIKEQSSRRNATSDSGANGSGGDDLDAAAGFPRGVRGADEKWRGIPVPSCWQIQVGDIETKVSVTTARRLERRDHYPHFQIQGCG